MFTTRSQEKELLDLGPEYYTQTEFDHCQKMLFRVNRLFGCFYDTVRFLKKITGLNSLMDVGCGGGLFLLNLSRYFPNTKLIGVDISTEAIRLAEKEQALHVGDTVSNVHFDVLVQPTLEFPENYTDVILTTMVCHHMSDAEIILFMQQAVRIAKTYVIINDLHRHKIAYWFYRYTSPILFRNRLITHDGLISIRRGFTRLEWETLLQQAGIQHYKISWRFPFRWRVLIWKMS